MGSGRKLHGRRGVRHSGMKRRRSIKGRTRNLNTVGELALNYSHGRKLKRMKQSSVAKIRAALTPISSHTINAVGRMSSPQGQCSYSILPINDPYALSQVITAVNSTAGHPEITGGAQLGIEGKLCIQDSSAAVVFKNQTAGVAHLRIYECVARHDVPYSAGTFATLQGILTYGFGQENATQPVNAVDATTIGTTLFQNPLWCSYFKILNVRQEMLGVGNDLKISMAHKNPHTINPLIWSPTRYLALSRYTRCVVIQQWGDVGSDAISMPSLWTTCPTELDYNIVARYNWNAQQNATGLHTSQSSGFSSLTHGVQVLNEKSGQETSVF